LEGGGCLSNDVAASMRSAAIRMAMVYAVLSFMKLGVAGENKYYLPGVSLVPMGGAVRSELS